MPSSLAFGPHGTRLAAGGRDRQLRLWRLPERKPARDFEGLDRAVRALAFGPDGAALASSGWERECRIWSLKDGGEGQRVGGREGLTMAYSPDGKLLAVASWDGRVELFDGPAEKPAFSVSGHGSGVGCLAFSPDGRSLYTGSWDATALRWDLVECRRLAEEREKKPPREKPPPEKPPREQPPKEGPKEDPEPL
jgi:WD40 repeat protein